MAAINRFIKPAKIEGPANGTAAHATYPNQQHQQRSNKGPRRVETLESVEEFEFKRPGPRVTPTEEIPVAPVATKPIAESDPSFTSLDLPSDCHFYDFDRVSVRHLRASHQAKFSRAAKENSLRHVVDAISSTLEPGVSAYRLTPIDFYFVMYWQRVNSYSKTPYLIRTTCDGEAHNKKVAAGELPPETLQIEEVMSKTTLTEKVIDWPTVEAVLESDEVQDLLTRYPTIDVERMYSLVESMDVLPNHADKVELEWAAGYASFLDYQPTVPGGPIISLLDRVEIVKSMTPDDIDVFDTYIEAVTSYGVSNHCTLRCRECGEAKTVQLAIDATTFLPGTYGRIAFR